MPVKAGAKFSAEHQSLGYHQADIRPVEIPRSGPATNAVFALSEGDRRFTRYGYADLYQDGAKFELLYRLWPGTQHHLLWGDPAQTAAFGRVAHFCNASGFELMEPLTFKGREGSGHAGGRCAYADKSLDPGIDDWKKFAPSYRLWGGKLYIIPTPCRKPGGAISSAAMTRPPRRRKWLWPMPAGSCRC